MVNLVHVQGDRIAFPQHHLQYPLTPPSQKLQDGLAAYRDLQLDLSSQSLPQAQRREVTHFLRQLGGLLYRTLLPEGRLAPLDSRGPVLLELAPEWARYPWELLHDGSDWLALRQGVVRCLRPPLPALRLEEGPRRPLRVLSVTAQPLPRQDVPVLSQHEEWLGTRFITVAPAVLDPSGEAAPPYTHRAVEHARREDIDEALRGHPHVLLYSGFAQREGWVLEGAQGSPQVAPQEWLLSRLRQAARDGLRLLLLNDSLGLLDAELAARQDQALLDSGIEGLVRLGGRQARLREQDYLRTLVRALGEGQSLLGAHLGAVRRLQRRFAEGWDWSFPRLHLRCLPAPVEPAREEHQHGAEALLPSEAEGNWQEIPAPPLFAGRRRHFNRYAELGRLLEALQPGVAPAPKPARGGQRPGSSLVFLSGPPGSGKTHLALELARRLRRQFALTAYISLHEVPQDPFDLLSIASIGRPAGGSLQQLYGLVALHLGLRPADGRAPEAWDGVVEAHLRGGAPCLVILDRLDLNPAHDAFCSAVQRIPSASRFLVLSRAKPPLVPGRQFDLPPLDGPGLARVYGPELLERLAEHPAGAALREVCARDLLAGRLLRHLPQWPGADALQPALADARRGPGTGGATLVRLLARQAAAYLSHEAREALRGLLLFPHLAQRDVLAQIAGLEGAALQRALTELQWLGLLDSYDGERYAAVPPRLQGALAAQLLGTQPAAEAGARMLRAYRSVLAEAAAELPAGGTGASLALAGKTPAETSPQAARQGQRLGLERVNVAELAALLVEEQSWDGLATLAQAAQPLLAVPGWKDVLAFINQCLLGAGEALGDKSMQARALTRLAAPHLAGHQEALAQPYLEKALDLLRNGTAWDTLAEVYHSLSRCYLAQGRGEAAANLLLGAVELAQQLDQPAQMLRALEGLLHAWSRREDMLEEVERYLPARIAFLQQHGHPLEALQALRLGAEARLGAGQAAQAQQQLATLLPHLRGPDAAPEAYRVRLRLVECQAALGHGEPALRALGVARQEWQGPPDLPLEARVLRRIAQRLEEQNLAAPALQAYLDARERLQAAGDSEGLIQVLDHIGRLYFRLGEQAKSTRCYEERLQLQATLPAH